MNVFDYVNNISSSTENLWQGELSEKEYSQFMVNRALSQYYDTVLFAQEMNQRQNVPNKQHYDFLRFAIIHKRKRFAKWHKADVLDKVRVLAEHYKINMRTAEQYISLLNNVELDNIMEALTQGGRSTTKQTKRT